MRPVVIKESFGKNNKYIAAELSYSTQEIIRMGQNRLRKVLNRAERFLLCNGAYDVLLSKNLRELAPVQKMCRENPPQRSKKIPSSKVVECYLYAMDISNKGVDKRYIKRAIIYDSGMKGTTFENLSKICMDVKQVGLWTSEKGKGERLAQKLFEEYGVLMSVKDYADKPELNSEHIVIDVDEGRVRINDFVVDGAEFVSNSGVYGLDPAEEAACLGDDCDLSISRLMSGENVL